MLAVTGSATPAAFSTEIASMVPGSRDGHTKSTRSREAYTRGAYWPLTLPWAPLNSITAPDGSDTLPFPEVSQRPSTLARAPGLQAGPVRRAALRIPVMVGFPESTAIPTWPAEEARTELVAVNTRS